MELPVDHLKTRHGPGTNAFSYLVQPMQRIRHGSSDWRGFGFRDHRTSALEQHSQIFIYKWRDPEGDILLTSWANRDFIH